MKSSSCPICKQPANVQNLCAVQVPNIPRIVQLLFKIRDRVVFESGNCLQNIAVFGDDDSPVVQRKMKKKEEESTNVEYRRQEKRPRKENSNETNVIRSIENNLCEFTSES
jgi:hypothetical protein